MAQINRETAHFSLQSCIAQINRETADCFAIFSRTQCTKHAGISPAMMRRVKTTLHQIQQRVLQFVGADTLLVGHSLENDLRVLNLVHLKNLDTAILYPHPRVDCLCPYAQHQ